MDDDVSAPAPDAAAAVDVDTTRRFLTAIAPNAMVVGSSGRSALSAAAATLRQGGSAADAVAIAALTQTALSAGCWDSYAGILGALYYDAGTGTTHSLNAGYNTVREERDPLSIRANGRSSGRAVLVPGFTAGIAALHERFGRLPFAALFDPAIEVADSGIVVEPGLHALMADRRRALTRTPEGRQIFLTSSGRLHEPGDVLRQPALAATLRRVAAEGADYMYRGEWARVFVETVARYGGRLGFRDLADYRASWAQPLRTQYREHDVWVPALPSLGGTSLIEALHLIESANLARRGHYAESPDALYWLIHITRAARLGPTLPVTRRLERETAARLWREIERRGGLTYASRPRIQRALGHSDTVVAVDECGNVAVLSHSINSVAWGSTGLFIGGVSVPDSASFQQAEIAQAGPGHRLPDLMNPILLTRNGQPALAAVCVGASLHEMMIQCLISLIDFEMPLDRAGAAPFFLMPVPTLIDGLLAWPDRRFLPVGWFVHRLIVSAAAALGRPRGLVNPVQAIEPDRFSPEIVDAVRAKGQPLRAATDSTLFGYWTGIRFHASEEARLEGAVSNGPFTDPAVIGY